MSDFEINLTDHEELDPSSIGPMPAGDYELVAQTWEAKTAKSSGHKMISLTFEVVGPKFAGRKVWENIMLEGNGLNVSKGKLRNWRKAMGMDPDVNNFNLEALESMMNVPFNATLKVEEGRDKGDGTKWEDKNVIGKFAAGASTTSAASPTPAPNKKDDSSDDDGFDWDK
jgi:hypothetical protein